MKKKLVKKSTSHLQLIQQTILLWIIILYQ